MSTEPKIDVEGYQRISLEEMDPRGAVNLIGAICAQASRDYLKAARKERESHRRSFMRMECEQFFKSQYFTGLTGLDGEAVLEGLRRMI